MPELTDAVQLRPARRAELSAIAAIATGPIAGKTRFIDESFGRRHIIVAADPQRIVGYAIWDREFFSRPFVWLVGVMPSARRCGIAVRLLLAVRAECAGGMLFTSTNQSNAAMHALLAGIGFIRCGSVDGLDVGDPEVFYRLPPMADRPS